MKPSVVPASRATGGDGRDKRRRSAHLTRSLVVLRLQRQLEAGSWPRLQMSLIVALTGAAGLLCSFLLLHAGVDRMALRYPLALAGAYGVFLCLLWLWLRTKASDYGDVPDPTGFLPSGGGLGDAPLPLHSGGGGDFGGGGASGSFDGPAGAWADVAPAPSTSVDLPSIGDAAGSAFDADELAIPLVAIALAVGLALASLYVVYVAPALFAELLLDGALSYTLYRRLRAGDDSRHWFTTALRRTALPFALTAVFLAVAGAALSTYAPRARSIGEALRAPPAARTGGLGAVGLRLAAPASEVGDRSARAL
ncbi:hypothetical protein [Methylibium sp.]|uniref:hypothetical protein n=1 Tax=Methylibium sp. TaxID=2067992 RepID=UPI003D0E13F1